MTRIFCHCGLGLHGYPIQHKYAVMWDVRLYCMTLNCCYAVYEGIPQAVMQCIGVYHRAQKCCYVGYSYIPHSTKMLTSSV